LNLHRK